MQAFPLAAAQLLSPRHLPARALLVLWQKSVAMDTWDPRVIFPVLPARCWCHFAWPLRSWTRMLT